jgi:D-alanine transaminase
MDTIYLNGQYLASDQAKVSVFDRGFLFSDSVYEVIPYYQSHGFQLEQHIDRLKQSLAALNISVTIDFVEITDQLVKVNGGGNRSVYLQVSRGAGINRQQKIDPQMQPTVFACTTPIINNYTNDIEQVFPVKVIVCDDLRWGRCDIKSTSLLANILALQQAQQHHAHEALFLRDGFVLEGASSNLFIVEKNRLIAPVSSMKILSGTTSALIQKIAREHGVDFMTSDISYQRLISADEVWISSSTRGLLPVNQVDDLFIGRGVKGPLWKKLYELLAQYQQQLFA